MIFVTLLFFCFPPISLYEGQSLILAVLSTLRPSYFPELNSVDYFICGVLGEDTNKIFQTNIKALEHAVSAGYVDREAVTHLQAIKGLSGGYEERRRLIY